MRPHAASAISRLLAGGVGALAETPHRIDGHEAGTALRRILRRRGDTLQQQQAQQHGHWFGRMNCPLVPVTRLAVIFLKSGSDVNPTPLICWSGASKVKAESELT